MILLFLAGFLAASILWLIVYPWWIARSIDDIFDDSLERLRAAARHPTNRWEGEPRESWRGEDGWAKDSFPGDGISW